MGGSGNKKVSLKIRIVLNVLLKICIGTVFFLKLAPHASAIRIAQLSSERSALDQLEFPNDLNIGDPHGLHEPGNDTNNSGERPKAGDLTFLSHQSSNLNASVSSSGTTTMCTCGEDLTVETENSFQPDGLPIFHVTFTNVCLDCAFSNIHVACGQFTSDGALDPAVFTRLAPNDCLFNNGGPFNPQTTIAFDYISNFAYPMVVNHATPAC